MVFGLRKRVFLPGTIVKSMETVNVPPLTPPLMAGSVG